MAIQETRESIRPIAEEAATAQMFAGTEKSHLVDLLIILAKRKFLILGCTAAAMVISLVVAFLLPKYYTATAKILPPQQSQSMATAMLGQLGPLLGATAGKDLGLRNPNDLYVAMLRSRAVEDNLVNRFSLMSVYQDKLRVDTLRDLDSLTEVVAGKDGVISVSVEDRDPRRAATLANAYIEELTKLTKTLAVTDAGKRRIFFEQEVKTGNDELAAAEQALKRTEETTGIIQLDSQSKVMLQSYADLRAQVAAREVQVQSMRSYATAENPDLIRAEQELSALRSQVARFEGGEGSHSSNNVALAKVPSAGLEYVRKLRDVKYREALLELLTKQYEVARIDESKDASIIQVLDQAVMPERKSWPHRSIIVLLATLLAFQFSLVWAYLAESLQRAKEDPQHLARLQILKMYFFRGLKR
ncbi:MAG TPA: Wzz/FepE/Etk N-terminal domain-containing protein [Candidatus Angelobacter sp.]